MLFALFQSTLVFVAVTSTRTARTATVPVHADFSNQGLTSLPSLHIVGVTSLDLSRNLLTNLTSLNTSDIVRLQRLDLGNNQLKALEDFSFYRLTQLKWLSLRHNQLQTLQEHCFAGLGELAYLGLQENKLRIDGLYLPQNVFGPLLTLSTLELQKNGGILDQYNVQIFTALSNLETLGIDVAWDLYFPPGFAVLRNLKTLLINVVSERLYSLKNESFESLRNSSLVHLEINGHGSYNFLVETCVFCPLLNLKTLVVKLGGINVVSILSALYGLQHRRMDVIDLTDCRYLYSVTVDRESTRYLRNICVSKLSLRGTSLERLANYAFVDHSNSSFARCVEDLDFSSNKLQGDWPEIYKVVVTFRKLKRIQFQNQYIFSLESANCFLGADGACRGVTEKLHNQIVFLPVSRSLEQVNASSAIHRIGHLPDVIKLSTPNNTLKSLDLSFSQMSNCMIRMENFNVLETLALNGNNCYNVSEDIFDDLLSLRHLHLSSFNMNPQFFRERAQRMFRNLGELETLDLSYNNLIHLDPDMVKRHKKLKRLNLAGNRLQSVSLNFAEQAELQELDLSHNMLPTLTPQDRQTLDNLQAKNSLNLYLDGNELLCGCSDLDLMIWLQTTAVRMDGRGWGEDARYNYTCVTDTGEISSTAHVIRNFDMHWRRCIGSHVLGITSALFFLLLLALMTSLMVIRSWTHLCYLWKVMRKARLPQRGNFRKDVYVGYADTDVDCQMACVTLPDCLTWHNQVRILLRHEEEIPGSIRAEAIVEHMDDCWKILLLVTPDFANDEYLSGFTVHQAQRCITDNLPNRVIVLMLEHPHNLPPMPSLERLLRMIPERNVLHARRNTPPQHEIWRRLAHLILE